MKKTDLRDKSGLTGPGDVEGEKEGLPVFLGDWVDGSAFH